MTDGQPSVRRIAVYPIKSLDPMVVDAASVVPGGSLEYDREFAIVDAQGEYVNGKRTADVHRIRASYEFGPDRRQVRLREQGDATTASVDLLTDRERAEAWLSDFFDLAVSLDRRAEGGYPDLTDYPSGPTVISTATLREVASWFPEMTTEEARLRFRANIEIQDVPAFWEDRLYADGDEEVRFRIGEVTFAGVQPTPRCVVPLRDPHTGDRTDGFQSTFIQQREATYPAWGDETAFDHYFHLMVNTHIRGSEVGNTVTVGDPVRLLGTAPAPDPPG